VLVHFRRLFSADTAIHLAGVELCVVAVLTGGLALAATSPPTDAMRLAKLTRGDVSARGFTRLTAAMDPAMLALAERHAPQLPQSWGAVWPQAPAEGVQQASATEGSADESATIRLQDLSPEAARIWNAANPVPDLPNAAARPFKLNAGSVLDEARAVDCMTAAIYYEAAYESVDGQRAVAQVVLNRMRHPAFPKTVCGVVFQGSNRTTGCQFTFTCDGALNRPPNEAGWSRARQVAVAALNGYVMKTVGNATHYHANYVAPYWSPSLVKIGAIGAHIFYRWTGTWGLPPAFSGRYGGGEMDGLKMATLDGLARTPVKLEGMGSKDAVAPVVEPQDVETAPIAPQKADPTNPSAGGDMLADAEVLTAANAATDAGAVARPEELDWAGRPKSKAAPRVAMPSRGMF